MSPRAVRHARATAPWREPRWRSHAVLARPLWRKAGRFLRAWVGPRVALVSIRTEQNMKESKQIRTVAVIASAFVSYHCGGAVDQTSESEESVTTASYLYVSD